MGPLIVVIKPMFFSYSAGMSHAREPVQIKAFVPELAVEALHVSIINWLPRTDKVKFDTALIRPGIHSVTDELGTVVHDDLLRETPG